MSSDAVIARQDDAARQFALSGDADAFDVRRTVLGFVSRAAEAEYKKARTDLQTKLSRLSTAMAIPLNSAYTALDRLAFAEENIGAVTAIRQVAVNSFLLLFFALMYSRIFASRTDRLVAIGVVIYCAFFGYINSLERTPYIFVANGILAVLWPYLFITGNLVLSLVSGLAGSAALLMMLSLSRPFDHEYMIFVLFLVSANFVGAFFCYQLDLLRRREFAATAALSRERTRFRELLVRVLPEHIADRLHRGQPVSDLHGKVVILFADIVGFTTMAARHSPDRIVNWLDELFAHFDQVIEQHQLEKVKTIGDAYMAAGGLDGTPGNCERAISAASQLIAVCNRVMRLDGTPTQLRIGVHVGPALAGIIGNRRFLYDLWGDTVNVASRMEASSQPNAILVTDAVRDELAGTFEFERVPDVPIKGKGKMTTWLLRF